MADGRKRLSGSQYRKRKLEKEEDDRRLAGSLKKFFASSTNPQPAQRQPSTSQRPDVQPLTSTEADADVEQPNDGDQQPSGDELKQDDHSTNTPANTQTENIEAIQVNEERFKDPALVRANIPNY
ncbi:uncharacterized protein LOC126742953 [Anthonomus grandis grandis]|uniref:uncharacterized protein LOC126742953 n=1 Tax=Anthonomus grandis grandis TaxID=2921223 RepID=UPI0021660B7F|nr:uncharacterized protein LOC126742953 [Anthonomus grandis grandis]